MNFIHITVSLEMVAAVWSIVTAIRAAIPSTVLNIDGYKVWALVFVGAAVLEFQGGALTHLTTIYDYLNVLINVVILTAASIITDGGASMSGVKDIMRMIFTLNGKTNAVKPVAAVTQSYKKFF